jgi:hypothetical protein
MVTFNKRTRSDDYTLPVATRFDEDVFFAPYPLRAVSSAESFRANRIRSGVFRKRHALLAAGKEQKLLPIPTMNPK